MGPSVMGGAQTVKETAMEPGSTWRSVAAAGGTIV